jgi:translocator assembly and maintenance protein 41
MRLVRPEFVSGIVRDHFPPVDHALAYGSGVFAQPGLYSRTNEQSRPMIDFLFGVEDPIAWHDRNIECNPSHYSLMSLLGPKLIDRASRFIGCGVYFNAMVPLSTAEGETLVKYGVCSIADFEEDLLQWKSLYIAGRLHKAVHTIVCSERIAKAQEKNLASAMTTALLLSPPTVSTSELLRIICSLSYIGDIRLGIAEDSKKVHRIVTGSYDRLFEMYKPAIERWIDDSGISVVPRMNKYRVDHSSIFEKARSAEGAMYSSLPAHLGQQMNLQMERASAPGPTSAALQRALKSIVRRSSMRQACLGLLSAGPARAGLYLVEKMKKAVLTRQR